MTERDTGTHERLWYVRKGMRQSPAVTDVYLHIYSFHKVQQSYCINIRH